jgi:hypothetical protein
MDAAHEVLLRRDTIDDEIRQHFQERRRFFFTPRIVPEIDTLRTDKPESEVPVSLKSDSRF